MSDARRQPDTVEEISETEQLALVDREARHYLGIGGEEFGRRWRSGEYRDNGDPHITGLAMLLPGSW